MSKLKVNDIEQEIEVTPLWKQHEFIEKIPQIVFEEFSKTNILFLKDFIINPNEFSSIHLQKRISDKNEIHIIKVKACWGGEINLPREFLQKQIIIHVKTFYGERKIYSFLVDINYSIQNLKNKIVEHTIEETSRKSIYGLRLIYPMGLVQELANSSNTLEMYKIPHNAQLILFSKLTFSWDPNLKAATIKLSNNNLTANKLNDDSTSDYQTVLGNLEMTSSRHYWEIKIEKYVEEEDILIGIARKNINFNVLPHETGNFWGFACLCGKLCGPDGDLIQYGQAATTGDCVGVLLEFTGGQGTLSFYKNGAKLGVAYSNLQGSFYPAVSMIFGEVQVTLDPKASIPIN